MEEELKEYELMIRYFNEKIESHSPDHEETLEKRLYWMQKKNDWHSSWNNNFGKKFLTEEEREEVKKPPTMIEFCDLLGWNDDIIEMWKNLYE